MVRPLLCCVLLMLAACSKPERPEKERPPKPRAEGPQSDLGKSIQAPLDKAKSVEDEMQKAADEQRKAIDEATGG